MQVPLPAISPSPACGWVNCEKAGLAQRRNTTANRDKKRSMRFRQGAEKEKNGIGINMFMQTENAAYRRKLKNVLNL